MRPTLFSIGGVDVSAFFFVIMIGALAGAFVGVKFAKKDGLSKIAVLDMAIIAIIASMIGSRIFHILFEYPAYYWEKPVRVFYVWQGGFVSLGAFIASAVAWVVYFKIKKLDVPRYLDIGAISAPAIIFFVRTACLLTGCCFGRPTDFPLHITFTNPDSTAFYYHPNIPLHPTQIYFMLNAIVMFSVLYFVFKKRKFYGQVLAAFLIYEGISRFMIEFLRGDADRGMYFGGTISTGQIMMMISLISGIIIYLYYRKKRPV